MSSYPINHYINCDKFSPKQNSFLAAITATSGPIRFSKVVTDSNWHEAIRLEIEALENNDNRELNPGKLALGNKWVYQIMYNADTKPAW